MTDVDISGEIDGLVVNGVDVAPLVGAELNRRMPDRARMKPTDPTGYAEAWSVMARLWEVTVERARAMPEDQLHRSVDDEWSFIQTLRHLNFVTAAWVGGLIDRDRTPWHPTDLPWDEAPGWDGVPWVRDAGPRLDEVLAVRRQRQAMVADVIAPITQDRLDTELFSGEPGWPMIESAPVGRALHVVLNEEWEHRLYAERDLTTLANQ